MPYNYIPLWKLLIDKDMKKTQLRDLTGIGTNTLAKLSKNEAVSMDVLERICVALNCNIEDVVKITK